MFESILAIFSYENIIKQKGLIPQSLGKKHNPRPPDIAKYFKADESHTAIWKEKDNLKINILVDARKIFGFCEFFKVRWTQIILLMPFPI